MAPKRKAVSNVQKSESEMMKAETSRMKTKKKRKKQGKKHLKKTKPSWDRLVEILDEETLEDITDPTTKTTKRELVRKKLDSDDPNIKGEAEAVDEYFHPGAAKELLRTRAEQAYDSMRGNQSGGMIGKSDMSAKKQKAPKKKKIPQYYKGGGKVKKNYAYGGRVAKYKG